MTSTTRRIVRVSSTFNMTYIFLHKLEKFNNVVRKIVLLTSNMQPKHQNKQLSTCSATRVIETLRRSNHSYVI